MRGYPVKDVSQHVSSRVIHFFCNGSKARQPRGASITICRQHSGELRIPTLPRNSRKIALAAFVRASRCAHASCQLWTGVSAALQRRWWVVDRVTSCFKQCTLQRRARQDTLSYSCYYHSACKLYYNTQASPTNRWKIQDNSSLSRQKIH